MRANRMNCLGVVAAVGSALALFTTSASAQSAYMELRIIPQSGSVTGTVTDGPIDLVNITPADVGAARTRRFELQYRIIDNDTNDNLVPAGLTAAQIDITADVLGGPESDLSVARAQLSRNEVQLAGAAPPASTDSSGLPTGPNAAAQGLHRPFRGGIPAPAPNNSAGSNGAISGLNITGITPLTLAQSDQGNPNLDPSYANAWYGLYSFEFTAGDVFGGIVTFTASAIVDPQTGNRFAYWPDGVGAPQTSTQAGNASISVLVINIPPPGAGTALMLAAGLASARRRR